MSFTNSNDLTISLMCVNMMEEICHDSDDAGGIREDNGIE